MINQHTQIINSSNLAQASLELRQLYQAVTLDDNSSNPDHLDMTKTAFDAKDLILLIKANRAHYIKYEEMRKKDVKRSDK